MKNNLNRVKDRNAIVAVGDFAIETTDDRKPGVRGRMDIRLPGGEVGCIVLVQGEPTKDGTTWGWDGNIDKPTLKPELKTKHWSGTITSGQFITAT